MPDSIVWQSNQSGWILNDLEETIEFGERLSNSLQNAKIVLIDGPLGSGKTSLVKGFAKGLGIIEPITSPTFSLAQHYLEGQRALIHVDLYRLENPKAANDLFFQEEEEATSLQALMMIEWPSRLGINLEEAWNIKLHYWSQTKRLVQLREPFADDKNSSTSSLLG